MGFAFGSMQTIGSTVKPIARRSGTTISSPLQMVGVSHWARTSRSDWLKGWLVMTIPFVASDCALLRGADHMRELFSCRGGVSGKVALEHRSPTPGDRISLIRLPDDPNREHPTGIAATNRKEVIQC